MRDDAMYTKTAGMDYNWVTTQIIAYITVHQTIVDPGGKFRRRCYLIIDQQSYHVTCFFNQSQNSSKFWQGSAIIWCTVNNQWFCKIWAGKGFDKRAIDSCRIVVILGISFHSYDYRSLHSSFVLTEDSFRFRLQIVGVNWRIIYYNPSYS
jgi:hypothetical protein